MHQTFSELAFYVPRICLLPVRFYAKHRRWPV